MAEIDALLETYEQTLATVADLGDGLGTDDWDRPTDLPGWSVKDTIAHVAGVESVMTGHPVPEHTLPADLPHVKNDLGRVIEVHVDVRRPVPGPDIVAELRAVAAERIAQIRAHVAAGGTELRNPFGTMWPVADVIRIRIFDVWAHEQDIRRAVGRPGGLDGPAAALTRDRLASGLPRVVAKSGAQPGQSVAFDLTGPTTLAATVTVGDDGRGSAQPGTDPGATVRLAMGFETFVRLACGRAGADDADVRIGGDQVLGRAVLANLAMTP